MMPSVLDVAAMIGAIGSSAKAAASDVREAEYDIRQAQQTGASTSSGVTGGSAATGGVGASSSNSNSPVTSRGMSAAISIARRSL